MIGFGLKLILTTISFNIIVSGSVIPYEESEFQENLVGQEDVIDLSHFGYEAYGKPDEVVGEKLENFGPGKQNPEEVGSYFQGDILIPKSKIGRNGVSSVAYRWQNGIIPYVLQGTFSKNQLTN